MRCPILQVFLLIALSRDLPLANQFYPWMMTLFKRMADLHLNPIQHLTNTLKDEEVARDLDLAPQETIEITMAAAIPDTETNLTIETGVIERRDDEIAEKTEDLPSTDAETNLFRRTGQNPHIDRIENDLSLHPLQDRVLLVVIAVVQKERIEREHPLHNQFDR